MRVAFIVNDRRSLAPKQTTTALIGAAVRRGHEVVVASVGELSASPNVSFVASGCIVDVSEAEAVVRAAAVDDFAPCLLDDLDLCIVRTNPARDTGRAVLHSATLQLLALLEDRGCRVVNRPSGLARAASKLSLLALPERLRPRTLVTCDANEVFDFVRDEGRAVIKPLEGTRGRDVFVLQSPGSDANVRQIVDVVLRQGYAVVQEFVAGAEKGDVRVNVIDGSILHVDGSDAAVARVPGPSDFRSNLHAGGSAHPAVVTDSMRSAVEEIKPIFAREGLRHVGVDFVGHRILELNVFSPGGLVPSLALYGSDFATAVIEAFEQPV